MPENFKKILIRVPNWIGDGVLSIPATEAVKMAFPDAEEALGLYGKIPCTRGNQ